MVDQGISARHSRLKVCDGGAARRDADRGDAMSGRIDDATVTVDPREDAADDMERARQVGAGIAEEYAHRLADVRLERLISGQGRLAPVEDDDGWLLAEGVGVGEFDLSREPAVVVELGRLVVELALHHVVLLIDWREGFLGGLHVHESVHAVGDMHGHRGGCAVVDVQAGVEEAELAALGFVLFGRGECSATAGAGECVAVDVMGVSGFVLVGEG